MSLWLIAVAWVLTIGGLVLTPIVAMMWLIVWCRYLVPHASPQGLFAWLMLLSTPCASLFAYLAILLSARTTDIAHASLLLATVLFLASCSTFAWNSILFYKAEKKLREDIKRIRPSVVLQS